jgi:hypothetical protein
MKGGIKAFWRVCLAAGLAAMAAGCCSDDHQDRHEERRCEVEQKCRGGGRIRCESRAGGRNACTLYLDDSTGDRRWRARCEGYDGRGTLIFEDRAECEAG